MDKEGNNLSTLCSGVAQLIERMAVNHDVAGLSPAPGAILKWCYKCNQNKPISEFYKNKTRPDGYQSYCRVCGYEGLGTWLDCKCGSKFYIKHRNIKNRKTFDCPNCIILATIDRNKSREIGFTLTDKGYKYTRDLSEKHSYTLDHRKVIQDYLGRKLTRQEIVHHIDGNRINNSLDNLFLTDSKGHSKAHSSLDSISYKLIQDGKIKFNRESGEYELQPYKESYYE